MMGLGSWQLIRIASYARQSFRCQLVVARARLLSLQKVNYSLAMMRLAFGRISMRAFSTMHSRRGIGSDQRGPSMYGDESYFDKHSAMKLSSREKRRVLIEEYRRKANLFTHLVIEKFTEKEMKEAKSVLDFLSEVRANDPSALKLQLLLWGRLAEEVLKCKDRLQLEPIYIKNILNLWRDSSLESSNMLHPIELVKKLQAVSKSLPNVGFDSEAACIIMDVAIKKASRTKVEIIVTLLFRLICEAGVHPDAQLFERLMQAASIRHNLSSMEHLIHRQKNLYELDPTLNSLQYLLHGYCKKSEMEQAENVLDQMLNCPDTPNLDRKYVISDGYQAVLSSYHAIVEKSDGMKREEVARSAKLFFDKMKEHATTCRKSLCKSIPFIVHTFF
jgi:pentatricopeptide repeat protein